MNFPVLRMDLEANAGSELKDVESLISSKIPGSSCSKTPNQLLFTLPLASTNLFPGS